MTMLNIGSNTKALHKSSQIICAKSKVNGRTTKWTEGQGQNSIASTKLLAGYKNRSNQSNCHSKILQRITREKQFNNILAQEMCSFFLQYSEILAVFESLELRKKTYLPPVLQHRQPSLSMMKLIGQNYCIQLIVRTKLQTLIVRFLPPKSFLLPCLIHDWQPQPINLFVRYGNTG